VDRQSQVSLNRSTVPGCPTADALLSTVGSILFAQVVLDTAAVLQRRHHQLQQLARTLGFSSCSSLSACLQPATRVRGQNTPW
jgi:acid phosphatase family membrane protein YuiD